MAKKIPKTRKNSSYWKGREKAEQQWIAKTLTDDNTLNRKIGQHYQASIDRINQDIDASMAKLADKNGISLAEAEKAVSQADIEEMQRFAVAIVNEAKATAKRLGRRLTPNDFSKAVNDRMRLYNATMRINRLELLKARLGQELVGLGVGLSEELSKKLGNDYVEQTKRQAGILGDTVPPGDLAVGLAARKMIMSQVGGGSWSKSLWRDMDLLKAKLDVVLTQAIVQGKSPYDLAKQLREAVKETVTNASYVTERLARTESARIYHQVTMDMVKRYGYKYVKWYSEPGRCRTCRDIAEADPLGYGAGVYAADDVPSIPIHPNCRCSISAYWVRDENNHNQSTPDYASEYENWIREWKASGKPLDEFSIYKGA